LIAVHALTVDDFGVNVKAAEHFSQNNLLAWLTAPASNDASAVIADVCNHNCRWCYVTRPQTRGKVHVGATLLSSGQDKIPLRACQGPATIRRQIAPLLWCPVKRPLLSISWRPRFHVVPTSIV
jgi:hypothetical protein